MHLYVEWINETMDSEKQCSLHCGSHERAGIVFARICNNPSTITAQLVGRTGRYGSQILNFYDREEQ